jgi:predicted small secreted protein
MCTHRKKIILSLILVLLLLSGCGPNTTTSPAGDDIDRQAATSQAGSGTALLSYTYLIEDPPIFKLMVHPNIPLSIEPGESPGSYDVHGFGQTNATLEIMGGGGSGTCMLMCDVPVLYIVEGTLELDEVNNDCNIPLTFSRKFDHEETIITGDCPTVIMENFECSILFETLIDPNTYTFTKEFRELDMPAAAGVTLRAEIKNVIMPPGVEGICNW